jgi:ABC-2 type transport system ATP-binding protein
MALRGGVELHCDHGPFRFLFSRRSLVTVESQAIRPTTAGTASVLAVEGLVRSFGGRDVVRLLDLRLEPGERVAFWGPNGSGKSTVLRCIAGTLLPTSGEVCVCGHEAGSLEARALIGASLSQERSFDMRLTGHANLLFFARLRFGSEREAALKVAAVEDELELQALAAERINRASSGMIQQVALARALLGNPALVLLDEPTRSLDADARERLWQALERRTRTCVVMATHLDEDVKRCGRRVDFPT